MMKTNIQIPIMVLLEILLLHQAVFGKRSGVGERTDMPLSPVYAGKFVSVKQSFMQDVWLPILYINY